MPLIELLAPQPHEYILDLGCGDGTLIQKISEFGCQVIGVDSSPEMIEAANKLGLEAYVVNGEQLTFPPQFDAVFSNAALHWMTNPDAVIEGVFNALKVNGRFVAELGGAGNVKTVVNAIATCFQKRNLDIEQINPWYFPSVTEYQNRLQKAGFKVNYIELFERPTLLPQGIVGWLEMFAQQFSAHLPASEQSIFIQEVIEICQPRLCDAQDNWIADYVRLRFSATKQAK